MQFNRKIHGRTDYRKRLSLVKSRLPRLVVRKSLKNTLAQIIEFHENGDKIILSAFGMANADFIIDGCFLNRCRSTPFAMTE